MSSPPTLFELLPLHAIGALDPAESLEVDRALTASPGRSEDLVRWRDVVAAIGTSVTGKRAGHEFLRSGDGGPQKHMIGIGG